MLTEHLRKIEEQPKILEEEKRKLAETEFSSEEIRRHFIDSLLILFSNEDFFRLFSSIGGGTFYISSDAIGGTKGGSLGDVYVENDEFQLIGFTSVYDRWNRVQGTIRSTHPFVIRRDKSTNKVTVYSYPKDKEKEIGMYVEKLREARIRRNWPRVFEYNIFEDLSMVPPAEATIDELCKINGPEFESSLFMRFYRGLESTATQAIKGYEEHIKAIQGRRTEIESNTTDLQRRIKDLNTLSASYKI